MSKQSSSGDKITQYELIKVESFDPRSPFGFSLDTKPRSLEITGYFIDLADDEEILQQALKHCQQQDLLSPLDGGDLSVWSFAEPGVVWLWDIISSKESQRPIVVTRQNMLEMIHTWLGWIQESQSKGDLAL